MELEDVIIEPFQQGMAISFAQNWLYTVFSVVLNNTGIFKFCLIQRKRALMEQCVSYPSAATSTDTFRKLVTTRINGSKPARHISRTVLFLLRQGLQRFNTRQFHIFFDKEYFPKLRQM
ncbi:hypothetical protein BA724_01765 [Domibacillus iocasae]|uniref:Uncharacterized protein n=1 Tax=Domibacillus iocasae TaxID=1714016 RepID=A0A1E7DR43_9BACI|nr:hypothetical protein BA724_01765 [Domibacillus iocasae]